MRSRNSQSSGLIRNIDVSALAAILFVLLFMFMMVTAIPHYGVSADLPKVGHPRSLPGARREDALIVSILRDGTMYFGKNKTRPSDLPAQIREGVARGAEKKIYIRADGRLRYRNVREVLDAIRSAGVEKIAFLAEQAPCHLAHTCCLGLEGLRFHLIRTVEAWRFQRYDKVLS